ncbi:MAG: aminopeptidase N [Pseudomonadota bacterium]
MRTDTGRTIRLADYAPPAFLIETVDLDIQLYAEATRVRTKLAVRPNPDSIAPQTLILDGEALILHRLSLDGTDLSPESYTYSDNILTIPNVPQSAFEVETEVEIDPASNTQLMGLYLSNGIFCTQCEAEGFRRITFFPDRPDVLSVYTVRLEADAASCPVLLSNGNPVEAGTINGSGRHYALWHDPHPKPSYLFAAVGGDLDCVTAPYHTADGRDVELRIYIERGKVEQADFALDALKQAMRWDEERFGRTYDLDVFSIVAVSHFNMGAMENKGLNIFNDKYILASPDTATDADYENIDAIIAHEYFHNWTGNRITCRDWFQLCLKEGLTVFRDQEYTSDTRSRPVARIGDVRLLRAMQFEEDAGPLAHPVRPESYREINNFYTLTVYEKGAEVIRMLETLIGREAFDRGMQLYFKRCDGTAATVEDFIACFEDASDRSLAQFMRWYTQSGTPVVTAIGRHDAASDSYDLTLAQSCPPTPGQPHKDPFVIPVKISLFNTEGSDITLSTPSEALCHGDTVILDTEALTVRFDGVTAPPLPSLLRGFSAPVRLVTDLGTADLQRLARDDSDPFNRWEAVQRLMLAELTHDRGPQDEAISAIADALTAALASAALDPAFKAELLRPPSESDVAQALGTGLDPDAIHAAVVSLKQGLGARMAEPLAKSYAAHVVDGPYRHDADSAGRRALRATCLSLLIAGDRDTGTRLARAQFDTADNMTERFSALQLLVHETEVGDAIADTFYERYRDNPLVIDKWLGVHATKPGAATLDTVFDLTRHPAFTYTNPNRVRALIGALAMRNPTAFHRADGAGYDFVAKTVLSLDSKNPQVAARLLTAFGSWRKLEVSRRTLAEKALRSIGDTAGLSPDVADISGRMLAD